MFIRSPSRNGTGCPRPRIGRAINACYGDRVVRRVVGVPRRPAPPWWCRPAVAAGRSPAGWSRGDRRRGGCGARPPSAPARPHGHDGVPDRAGRPRPPAPPGRRSSRTAPRGGAVRRVASLASTPSQPRSTVPPATSWRVTPVTSSAGRNTDRARRPAPRVVSRMPATWPWASSRAQPASPGPAGWPPRWRRRWWWRRRSTARSRRRHGAGVDGGGGGAARDGAPATRPPPCAGARGGVAEVEAGHREVGGPPDHGDPRGAGPGPPSRRSGGCRRARLGSMRWPRPPPPWW